VGSTISDDHLFLLSVFFFFVLYVHSFLPFFAFSFAGGVSSCIRQCGVSNPCFCLWWTSLPTLTGPLAVSAMQPTTATTSSCTVQLSRSPLTRSLTLHPIADSAGTARRAGSSGSVADLSSDDTATVKEVFELPRSSSRSSPLELVPTGRKNAVHPSRGVSSTSGGPLNGNTSKHNTADIPLSFSSRGLESTVYTDDILNDDAADDDDDGSVGSCTGHDVDMPVSTVKAAAASSQYPQTQLSPSAVNAAVAAPRSTSTPPHAFASTPSKHFSAMTPSPTSWSEMRKLWLESVQCSLTGVGASANALNATDLRGPNRSGHSFDQLHRPGSTVATSTGFLSSSCAAQPGNKGRGALHMDNNKYTNIHSGGSSCIGNHGAPSGYWTLAPRLRGVNEILLTTHNSHLFREALDSLHVWDTALQLDLHHNSAGGTYMVREAASSKPKSPVLPSTSASNKILCVFKPRDEEIGQETNPHGNRESDRTGAFAPGSGSRREVLAYRLDHGHNAGVPPTIEVASGYCRSDGGHAGRCGGAGSSSEAAGVAGMGRMLGVLVGHVARSTVSSPAGLSDLSTRTVGTMRAGAASGDDATGRSNVAALRSSRCGLDDGEGRGASTMPQIGSLQLFLPGCQEAADVLPGHFKTEEVHALAIFDIRTLNGDRHGGNVLVQNYRSTRHRSQRCRSGSPLPSQERAPHLIPIDHSYICPSGYADPDYEWLSWPQAKLPFSVAQLRYIAALDADADAELVRAALLAHSSLLPMGTSNNEGRGGGGADIFDISACTNCREADGTDPVFTASCVSSERTRELLWLDDGVRHARAVAQEYGVPPESPVCGLRATCGAAFSLQAAGQGSHHHRCSSFNDLIVFSPVRDVHHRSNASSCGHGNAVAESTLTDAFGSPHGFSMTAPPEPSGGFTEGQARPWDRWAEATAQLLNSSDYDDGDSTAGGVPWGKEPGSPPVSTADTSSTTTTTVSSSLSFPTYGAGSVITSPRAELSNAVTYDKGAANAAAEVMRCTTRLLQVAALEFHLTAYEIGSLCRRPRVAQASFLEEVMEEARDELTWEVVPTAFDALVRQRLYMMRVK
jgi:hypothetical protein